ncbi:Sjogren's syndrome/scleroderma autoantigen 1 family protein [Salinigranum marinum]|uniref:Sjogren's syndrome/scleroderma autoantigen 1 family protein n=1 Tax=Salinigranum marinum TaxID=1515595 RepID=UPI002989E3EA|nr:Sjogren's syndrome/scleroderma autoantigen 1 family protein [Salinigranum marinum]
MSDFDKEAEREKLREKYEHDREKRKETERMSQLLLQGATMTNRHCDTCGDPLFRYQGQEFCATCEGRAQEASAAAAEADEPATDVPGDSGATAGVNGADAPVDAAEPADSGPEPTGDDAEAIAEPGTPPAAIDGEAATGGRATDAAVEPGVSTSEPPASTTRTGTEPDLQAARASLVRTITHHTQRAEAVEDPRRVTDHLTAVREAAEALAALDGRR